MTIEIDIVDETKMLKQEDIITIEKLSHLAYTMENIGGDVELSIVFVDNDKIQEINATYRGKDQPTDVISFALEDEMEGDIAIVGGDIPRVLGDILVSVPKAIEQAETHGHSFIRELGFLVIHGFLHLLGYDHESKDEEVIMFARQDTILSQFGIER